MKNIILVPTDFTLVSEEAIHYSANLAKKLNASIAIVHITSSDKDNELVQFKLSKISEQIKTKFDISVDTISRKGSIFSTINEICVEIGAKLMVLGTHGKVGVQQQLTGSFAHKVVSKSDVPVIVVQEGVALNEEIRKIVFTVSSTANVRQKVNWAVQIAKIFNAKIYIFNFPEVLKETRMAMNVIVNQITNEFDKHSIEYEIHDAERNINFGQQVLLFLKTIKADLIMIMSNPDKLNFMISPYDEQIMFNKSGIPTMLINPKDLQTYHWY